MADRTPTPAVPVIADRQRNLRYNAAAIAQLEEDFNCPIAEVLANLSDSARRGKFQVRLVLALVAAGVQHEDPGTSWRTIGNGLEVQDLQRLMPDMVAAIVEAMKHAFPPKKGTDPNPPVAAVA